MERDLIMKMVRGLTLLVVVIYYAYEILYGKNALLSLGCLIGFFLIVWAGMVFGSGGGCVAGTLVGLVLTLWNNQADQIGVLCLSGMLLGFFSQAGVTFGLLGFLASFLGGSIVYAPHLFGTFGLELFLAVGLFALFQEKLFAGQMQKNSIPIRQMLLQRNRQKSQKSLGGNRYRGQASALEQWTQGYAQQLLKLSSAFQTVPVLSESFCQLSATLEQATSLSEEHRLACEASDRTSRQVMEPEKIARANKRRVRNSFAVAEQQHFMEGSDFSLRFGTAKSTKDGELISGDHFSCTSIAKDRVALGIFDGMGSGRKADRDSRRMIETMEELLMAGFSLATSLRMLHTMMLYEKEEDTTLSVDFAQLDLEHGECEMLKAGSAASFLVHGTTIEIIRCESLPIGIMPECDPASCSFRLRHGDVLVMVSDGVLEAIDAVGKEEALAGFLSGLSSDLSPQEYADAILDFARFENASPDDMLVLTVFVQ